MSAQVTGFALTGLQEVRNFFYYNAHLLPAQTKVPRTLHLHILQPEIKQLGWIFWQTCDVKVPSFSFTGRPVTLGQSLQMHPDSIVPKKINLKFNRCVGVTLVC